jgi:hypothetical protein
MSTNMTGTCEKDWAGVDRSRFTFLAIVVGYTEEPLKTRVLSKLLPAPVFPRASCPARYQKADYDAF